MIARNAFALYLASAVALAGCDIVFGLDGTLATSDDAGTDDDAGTSAGFCSRHAEPNVLFCADFDDPNATHPFSQFTQPESGQAFATYAVETDDVRSAPNAALLAIAYDGVSPSPDARLLLGLTAAPSDLTVEVSVFIEAAPTEVKLLTISTTNRNYAIMSSGRVVGNIGGVFSPITTCAPLPARSWTAIHIEIDPVAGGGRLSIGSCEVFWPSSIDQDGALDTMPLLSLGPHDPSAVTTTGQTWTVVYDDVLVRETN